MRKVRKVGKVWVGKVRKVGRKVWVGKVRKVRKVNSDCLVVGLEGVHVKSTISMLGMVKHSSKVHELEVF